MQAYTYLIGWSKHNMWYYGVRYSSNCKPKDLWKTYFTSSKHVKSFRKKYGEPDIIQIRRLFDNKEKAILWEEKVLKRMGVKTRTDFLNKNDRKAPPILKGKDNGFYGKHHSEDVLKLLRQSKSEEEKENYRKPKSIITLKSKKHKKNISKSHIGINHSEKVKNRLRNMSEKYEYKIMNIFTNEIFVTKNLSIFEKEHPSCNKTNLVKTCLNYQGKKTQKHSGGFKIIERILLEKKKEKAILQKKDQIITVVDLKEFCKEQNINLNNLRKTSPVFEGVIKLYTYKGYKIIKYLE